MLPGSVQVFFFETENIENVFRHEQEKLGEVCYVRICQQMDKTAIKYEIK